MVCNFLCSPYQTNPGYDTYSQTANIIGYRLYRAKVLFTINASLRDEITWLNPTALKHLKNYQIWHHRQTIVDKLDSPEGETAFISRMFEADAKNYHVWSYRQWLVRRFDLWDKGELESTEEMLKMDIRNNSAWNHRWFVVFGHDEKVIKDQEILNREIELVFSIHSLID